MDNAKAKPLVELKRCNICVGSGKIMGGGMIMKNCHACKGLGKIAEAVDDIDYLQMKTTETFKTSVERLKAVDKTLSDEDAEKILCDAIDDEKPKKGGKK